MHHGRITPLMLLNVRGKPSQAATERAYQNQFVLNPMPYVPETYENALAGLCPVNLDHIRVTRHRYDHQILAYAYELLTRQPVSPFVSRPNSAAYQGELTDMVSPPPMFPPDWDETFNGAPRTPSPPQIGINCQVCQAGNGAGTGTTHTGEYRIVTIRVPCQHRVCNICLEAHNSEASYFGPNFCPLCRQQVM